MMQEKGLRRRSSKPLIYGAPGEIRTPDPLVRSQVLYPTELRAHICLQIDLLFEAAHYPVTLSQCQGFTIAPTFSVTASASVQSSLRRG